MCAFQNPRHPGPQESGFPQYIAMAVNANCIYQMELNSHSSSSDYTECTERTHQEYFDSNSRSTKCADQFEDVPAENWTEEANASGLESISEAGRFEITTVSHLSDEDILKLVELFRDLLKLNCSDQRRALRRMARQLGLPRSGSLSRTILQSLRQKDQVENYLRCLIKV